MPAARPRRTSPTTKTAAQTAAKTVSAAIGGETCDTCTAPFEAHTERTPGCTVCLRWTAMRARAHRRGETFDLDVEDFATWMAAQARSCTYCGVDEADLRRLGVLNQTGARVERLGVDRLDGELGYVPSNMTPACFVCNRTKSDWYTPAEMRVIGAGIARVWEARLGRCRRGPRGGTRGRRTRERSSARGADTCGSCASPFEPHTPGTPLCTVCVRYRSLRGNARRVRRDGTNPELGWDLKAFAAWFARQERACTYCGIDETTLPLLGLPTQVGLPLQRLGIDRLDGSLGYDDDNAALCCLACNRIRSATFTPGEMRVIAPSVRRLWDLRLAAGAD